MKTRHLILTGALGALALGAATLAVLAASTDRTIQRHRVAVSQAGLQGPSGAGPSAEALAALPAPVQRYLAFAFPEGVPRLTQVELSMAGQFRRPGQLNFTPTTAQQTIAAGTPAMLFDATTPIVPGVWARAYDAFVDGRMEMKAKILSAVAVVDEPASAELDRISLRRWLLESPLYPVALLPGGPVRWEAVDAQRARAVVQDRGMAASLLATFGADGALLRFDAETDGDLTTPYHGSGEHVARSDYQRVDGMMIPLGFTVARAAGGQLYPFWEGRVTRIRFTHLAPAVATLGQAAPRR